MKILFAASECVPFVKTGGLADVVGALPKEIRKNGEDVRVILPLYKAIGAQWREKMQHVLYFYVNLGWRHQYVGVQKLEYEGITFYFIDNEQYFGRDYIYGLGGDEGERFAFFCRAVLDIDTMIMALGTSPNPLIRSTTPGLDANKHGCIVTQGEDGLTSREGVYAGGDAVTGAATVILAMGAGKNAAKAIDEYIRNK